VTYSYCWHVADRYGVLPSRGADKGP
jgi:hypothetical protein